MAKIIKPAIALFAITAIVSALLGFVNLKTDPVIKQNELIAAKKALSEVLPLVKDNHFSDKNEVTDYTGVKTFYIGYNGDETAGYVVEAYSAGYGGVIKILAGFSIDGKITGLKIISHSETPGLGENASKPKFLSQYLDKQGFFTVKKSGALEENEVLAIAAATITTNSVTQAVNYAVTFFQENLAR